MWSLGLPGEGVNLMKRRHQSKGREWEDRALLCLLGYGAVDQLCWLVNYRDTTNPPNFANEPRSILHMTCSAVCSRLEF